MATIFVVFTSCIPVARHPLSDDQTSRIDSRLLGTWRIEGSNDSAIFRKLEGSTNTLELVELLEPDEDAQEADNFVLFTTEIDSQWYMTTANPTEKDEGVWIVRYVIDPEDTMNVYFMDADVISEAISQGALRGEVKTTKHFAWVFGFIPIPYREQSVTITESSDGLARYLKQHGEKCFEGESVLTLKRNSEPGADNPQSDVGSADP
jgi:hypothetical protein